MKDSGSFECSKIKNVEGPRVEKICEKIHKVQHLEATNLAKNR